MNYIKIDPRDNVIVALTDLPEGTVLELEAPSQTDDRLLVVQEDVPAKHKIFMQDMLPGDEVLMYGVLVGKAICFIPKGGLMSIENTRHASQDYAYGAVDYQWQVPDVSAYQHRTFNGYHRKDGRVGTANYWLFIPTVFCENRNLDVIKEALHHTLGYTVTDKYRAFTAQLLEAYERGEALDGHMLDLPTTPDIHKNRVFKNVDGIKFLNHQGGCGGTRQDAALLSKLLAAYADHPNVAGVTVLSLGCQHLQTANLLDDLKSRNSTFDKPVLLFEQQQSKGEEQLIKEAILHTFRGLQEINQQVRQPAPLSALCVGVKCGGSDGFSGISANPAVGYASDLLVAMGAKVLLAEFPELCGAEQNLIDRCVDEATANKFIRLMREYDAQAHAVGSGFYMNPSPGNIKDGLITDAIKSTGAAKKGGTSPVVDVLDYTEPATLAGLSLVCTPGNDVEATTGKAASGATLILFTTGLGTPTGNPVCPVIKVATNTALADRMRDIIDIDTGAVIRAEKTIEQMGKEILEYCIRAASGDVIPKAMLLNQDDFIPWKRGVSL
ncbi:dehydratase [Pedobacter quisquiliarum]|uniref:Dehydratase n=1 Tax=Pedobacter quisquiliarum TaxID=1834438 RepID=A0A916XDC8_9SPHI|nr:altronate dehydratase family protein [Pedobacter quisquiliarum]GGC62332.1 dehydratase [Pedobacter quisquiliarum]